MQIPGTNRPQLDRESTVHQRVLWQNHEQFQQYLEQRKAKKIQEEQQHKQRKEEAAVRNLKQKHSHAKNAGAREPEASSESDAYKLLLAKARREGPQLEHPAADDWWCSQCGGSFWAFDEMKLGIKFNQCECCQNVWCEECMSSNKFRAHEKSCDHGTNKQ